jgi:hypothetical protein
MVWVLLFLFSAWFTKEDAKRKRRLIKGCTYLENILGSYGGEIGGILWLYTARDAGQRFRK